MYDRYDKEIKRLMASRVELVNDVWMSRSLTMMNLVTNRLSNMAFVEIYTDLTIDDEFLTQRTLTDAAYRETELESLRAPIKSITSFSDHVASQQEMSVLSWFVAHASYSQQDANLLLTRKIYLVRKSYSTMICSVMFLTNHPHTRAILGWTV